MMQKVESQKIVENGQTAKSNIVNALIETKDPTQKPIRLMHKEIEDLKNGQTKRRREELNELDPLFMKEIVSTPVPKKFRIPQITLYDGLGNPMEHIEYYQDLLIMHGTALQGILVIPDRIGLNVV